MRNRIFGKQLNRTSEHRTAMLRNLAAGLFEHGFMGVEVDEAKLRRVVVDAKRADDRAPVAQHERLPRQERLALPPRGKARKQPVPGAALVLEDVAVLRQGR